MCFIHTSNDAKLKIKNHELLRDAAENKNKSVVVGKTDEETLYEADEWQFYLFLFFQLRERLTKVKERKRKRRHENEIQQI